MPREAIKSPLKTANCRIAPSFVHFDVHDFCSRQLSSLVDKLSSTYATDGLDISNEQARVWRYQCEELQRLLKNDAAADAVARIVFEFPRPGEGYRRVADVLLLLKSKSIAVLEFKHRPIDEYDQRHALADAKHLNNCHSESHGRKVQPFMLITKKDVVSEALFSDQLPVEGIETGYPRLKKFLCDEARETDQSEWKRWLDGTYLLKPSLLRGTVHAILFNQIPELTGKNGKQLSTARKMIKEQHQAAQKAGQGLVIIVDGAPGAGKTLLGISLVAEFIHQATAKQATFFSGNAPLVSVLKSAINKYSKPDVTTDQLFKHAKHVKNSLDEPSILNNSLLVFDEAQRAWQGGNNRDSELSILWEWAAQHVKTLVLLVGKGQAIYSNEMPDKDFWQEIRSLTKKHNQVTVCCSNEVESSHQLGASITKSMLSLRNPIRQHGVDKFAEWIEAVIAGNTYLASQLANTIRPYYPLKIFSDKNEIETAARSFFAQVRDGKERFRFGWFISSQAEATKFPNRLTSSTRDESPVSDWYLCPPTEPKSCCLLDSCSTEFTCQGLEVDISLLAWGDDFFRRNHSWDFKPGCRQLDEFTVNTYRVLLSRGRQGLFVYCSDVDTYNYLSECGMDESDVASDQ